MLRKPVESSSIASIGYDPIWKMLDVEFKESGEVYRYFDVSPEQYDTFIKAESKGTHLNQEFKKLGHRYEKLKP